MSGLQCLLRLLLAPRQAEHGAIRHVVQHDGLVLCEESFQSNIQIKYCGAHERTEKKLLMYLSARGETVLPSLHRMQQLNVDVLRHNKHKSPISEMQINRHNV